ncbi:AAA family ATPase [Rhodobacteraceae bacterium R_SAG4]|nr:AAA family ATPase [Rhodobacteraceae bacterium R_SAG4]
MMIFGIAGASGTGKTTLGRMVGDALDIPFQPTSITNMAAKAGFDPVSKISLNDRLILQESMLDQMETLLASFKTPVILDRTPLDLVGYMMAEIYMHSESELTADEMRRIDAYVSRCQDVTVKYCSHIFVTGLLPEYELVETRPGWNPAYQRHVHLLIVGALMTSKGDLSYSMFNSDSLTGRTNYMIQAIQNKLVSAQQEKIESRYLH